METTEIDPMPLTNTILETCEDSILNFNPVPFRSIRNIRKNDFDSNSSTSTSTSLNNTSTAKANMTAKNKILKSTVNTDQLKNKCKFKFISDSNLDSAVTNLICENSIVSCRFCRIGFETLQHFSDHDCGKCHKCTSNFNSIFLLDKHKKNNCTFCNALFTKQKALCNHLKSKHNILEPETFYHCSFCDEYCSESLPRHCHLKSHVNNQHLCFNCGFMSDTDSINNDQTKKPIEISKYECKLCGKKFIRRQQHEQHMMGYERNSCSKCDSKFSTKKMFLKHQSVHGVCRTVKKYSCPVCSKLFQRPKQLQMHQRTHTGEMPVKCSHCDKSFCNSTTLSKHMQTVSHIQRVNTGEGKAVEVEKSFLCSECGARFYQRKSLLRHIELLHTASESVKCPHCDYNTNCKPNLKRHIELHRNIKRFICEICGSSFRAFATLKQHHAFMHSEKKHFTCSVCNKSFKTKSTLKRHMRIHSEVRAYDCQCGKKFKRMSHLKRHMAFVHDTTFKTKQTLKSTNSDASMNHQHASATLNESVEAIPRDSSAFPFLLLTFKLCDTVGSENMDELPSQMSEEGLSNTMQICLDKHYIHMLSHNNSVPVMLPQSDYPTSSSVHIGHPTFNLSPANYCSFDLPSSPIDIEASTRRRSIDAPSNMLNQPCSLPNTNFQNQSSNTDSSLQNPNSLTAVQMPSSLHTNISSPSHVSDLNTTSKQLFSDSDDILSLLHYSSNTPSSSPSHHLFNSAREIDLWDTGDDSICRLKLPNSDFVSSLCANNFSRSLLLNANNLLADNLFFSHDSMNVCSFDSNALNSEFDSLT